MFDTHAHLNFSEFEFNLDEIIRLARDQGVDEIVVPSVDIKTSKVAIDISRKYKNIYPAVGIHPTLNMSIQDIKKNVYLLEEILEGDDTIVAIGETGLDYYHKIYSKIAQIVLFEEHIKLARKYEKPLIIHSRHSTEDLLSTIQKYLQDSGFKAVFHSVEADTMLYEFAIENNIFIGISGDITKNYDKQKMFKKSFPNNFVFETDSPYQSPIIPGKNREKVNKPSSLPYIIEFTSELFGISVDLIKKMSIENAHKLFF